MITGNEFKARRIALGYATREALADDLGVTAEAVKKWENDSRPVALYAIRFVTREEKRRRKKTAAIPQT